MVKLNSIADGVATDSTHIVGSESSLVSVENIVNFIYLFGLTAAYLSYFSSIVSKKIMRSVLKALGNSSSADEFPKIYEEKGDSNGCAVCMASHKGKQRRFRSIQEAKDAGLEYVTTGDMVPSVLQKILGILTRFFEAENRYNLTMNDKRAREIYNLANDQVYCKWSGKETGTIAEKVNVALYDGDKARMIDHGFEWGKPGESVFKGQTVKRLRSSRGLKSSEISKTQLKNEVLQMRNKPLVFGANSIFRSIFLPVYIPREGVMFRELHPVENPNTFIHVDVTPNDPLPSYLQKKRLGRYLKNEKLAHEISAALAKIVFGQDFPVRLLNMWVPLQLPCRSLCVLEGVEKEDLLSTSQHETNQYCAVPNKEKPPKVLSLKNWEVGRGLFFETTSVRWHVHGAYRMVGERINAIMYKALKTISNNLRWENGNSDVSKEVAEVASKCLQTVEDETKKIKFETTSERNHGNSTNPTLSWDEALSDENFLPRAVQKSHLEMKSVLEAISCVTDDNWNNVYQTIGRVGGVEEDSLVKNPVATHTHQVQRRLMTFLESQKRISLEARLVSIDMLQAVQKILCLFQYGNILTQHFGMTRNLPILTSVFVLWIFSAGALPVRLVQHFLSKFDVFKGLTNLVNTGGIEGPMLLLYSYLVFGWSFF